MIAFPLGGIAAGSIALGGRGQLRDWEIFNRPEKGNAPPYAYASIWAQVPGRKPVAKVAESRFLAPYEGASGLGSNNSPGLQRLDSAVFTGEYPMARIDFKDRRLPVKLSLEAFTPFYPLDADASGLPVAVLRYKVTNPNPAPAQVGLCFSIDNPLREYVDEGMARPPIDQRTNERREAGALRGMLMTNPALADDNPLSGNFTLAALGDGEVSIWRGWPQGRWWNSPMKFWDEFSAKGLLTGDPDPRSAVGAVCVHKEIAPHAENDITFVLAWHFPNRTPRHCGWHAEKGFEHAVIGNHYCTRFKDSWAAAEHLAENLAPLESKTRLFVQAMRDSTLPGAVKDAAMSNLSTLVSQVCFRTADGEFHGFEGANEKGGCCHGSCTHVWNYETATAHLFPSLARSLRKAAFGDMMDDTGAIHFRETLPKGTGRSGFAAADGQMGQIMKVYLDWRLSGDADWLKQIWPLTRKAMEFTWMEKGWDPGKTGVLQGPQHNTYDVEFYGPNPMCGIYYLGALRACESMARTVSDPSFANECRELFEKGSKWIDANLFNGEFYIQQIRGLKPDRIARTLVSDMGSDNSEQPEYQVGAGCLVDQLVGQYQSEVCGLGPLVNEANLHKTLDSIYRYNYKRDLSQHNCVQRTFALNDESAIVICDYGQAQRPSIPFPYYAEVMTGFEYQAATLMIYAGLVSQGLECIENIRRRYDGQFRNPWDEAECGHHYARAMAAWTGVLALSGFLYDAPHLTLSVTPRMRASSFQCIWSTTSGWGTFKQGRVFSLKVEHGSFMVREVLLPARDGFSKPGKVTLAGQDVACQTSRSRALWRVQLMETIQANAGETLSIA
jgi:non-lysosomal glucosylceramidase